MLSKAELVLEGNTYLLNSVFFEISQAVDHFGRPSSVPKGGKIEIELDSIKDDVLFDWMVHSRKTMKGSINLYESDHETKLKELKFENAFCIGYGEIFEEAREESLITRLIISAEKLSIGNIDMDNAWLK
jgi:hypothetical protein